MEQGEEGCGGVVGCVILIMAALSFPILLLAFGAVVVVAVLLAQQSERSSCSSESGYTVYRHYRVPLAQYEVSTTWDLMSGGRSK